MQRFKQLKIIDKRENQNRVFVIIILLRIKLETIEKNIITSKKEKKYTYL